MCSSHVFSGLFSDCGATTSICAMPLEMPKWSYDSAVCCPICCPIRLEKWGVVPVLSPIESVSLGWITSKYDRRI